MQIASRSAMLGSGSAPPVGIAGIITLTTGQDNLGPGVNGRGVYYADGTVPQSPPVSGTEDGNTTGQLIENCGCRVSGSNATSVMVAFLTTSELAQDAFTSVTVQGFAAVLSADASSFSSSDLGTGYWLSSWEISVTPGTFNLAQQYTFTFA